MGTGILENDYGVPHSSITWVTERDEDGDFEYHADLKVERIAEDQDLDDMLANGDLDAIISPNVARGTTEGDDRIGRLWPDYKDVEIAYYKATGIFPIMHVTTIRQEIVDAHPWMVDSLIKAFDEAKKIAYRRLTNPRIVPLAFYRTAWEGMLGNDANIANPGPVEFVARRIGCERSGNGRVPLRQNLIVRVDEIAGERHHQGDNIVGR